MKKLINSKIYVGCGNDTLHGHIGCDIRTTKTAEIVCKAWEISNHFNNAEKIYSRHMLEHLTFKEMEICLLDWHKTLKVGGSVLIIVPNIDFHIKQWLKAKWDDTEIDFNKSNARWSMAGFWGWQNECDPTEKNYNNSYWDVHKSGYNNTSLKYFLKDAGFNNIKCTNSKLRDLQVKAFK